MSGTSRSGPRYSTTAMLERLVSFDTTSRNSNLGLIGFVRDYLELHGVPYRISSDASGTKSNIHAIVGPQSAGGIALSGHVDTVPVDGQTWTSDPFALKRREGRLHGRGTTDMKGFVASALAAIPDLRARPLARPLHLFLTYDEEVTCNGARRLLLDLDESGLRPDCCIVGEPSKMKPVVAHKGRMTLRVIARGVPGHSSDPARGVNAIQAVAEAIVAVGVEARRFAAEGPFEEGFEPPHTTIHVGTVQGGTILNIIPEYADFLMEWRTIPADDFFREIERFKSFVASTIEPGMQAVHPDAGFSFEIESWIPGFSLDPDHALATTIRRLCGTNGATKVSYATEAGLYQQAGIPTIICGPGDIVQAHRPDEWIAESQLRACDSFLRRVAALLVA